MDAPGEVSAEDAKGLIHELRVHQIELEMQNDELRRSQIQLEESRMRYADLYDFSPVGYLTFDQEGLIVEANLSAAKQLGKERARILTKPFFLNIFRGDRDAFHLHLAQVFKTRERQTCEVRLAPEIGEEFYARLDSIFIEDASGKCFARTSITDITDRKLTELELRAKLAIEQEFHSFVSEVGDYAIFMLDPAGCVVSWNAGAEHTKGYKANEIISRNHACFYTPEDIARDWPRQLLQRAIVEKRVEDEGWRVRKDGSRFWASVVITAVYDNGRLRGFSKVTRDITEQARLVADLQQSESKYRELVQNANSVIIRWKRDGTLTFLNEYARKFFGYSAEEVIGKSVNILMPEQGSTGGDLAEQLQDIVNHPERYVNNINENVLRDGSRVWMAWTNQPIFNDDGQVQEILTVASDITERKQAEEALRESRERFEALAKASFEGIGFSHDGIIIDANAQLAQMLGYDPSEIIGKPVADLVAPEDRELVRRYMEAGYEDRYENRLLRKDRSTLVVETQAKHFAYRGRVIRVTAMRDITERKQAEEALRTSEQKFRLLHETMHAGVVFQDANGKIVSMNSAAKRILGRTEEEFLGETSVSVEHHTIREDGSPFPGLEHPAMVALRTGRVVDGVVMGVFNPLENVYRWIEINATPLFRKGEKIPYQVYAVFSDITERKQAESLLQRQAELLHLSYDAIIVWQQGGRIESWNKGAEELYGYSQEEALGQVTHDLLKTVHPELRPRIEAKLRERKFWEGELKHHTRDGREVIVSARHQLVRGADGVERVLETNRDITERKEAEAILRESEERYSIVFNRAPFPISLSRLRDGVLVNVNEAWMETFGFSRREAIGKTPVQLGISTDHEERALLYSLLQEKGSVRDFEVTGYRTKVNPESVILANLEIMEFGGEKYVYTSAQDITYRKMAENALRESESKLHAALASIPDAVFISDAEGRLVNFNDGFVTYHRFRNRDECSRSIADCPIYLDAYMADGLPATPEMWAIPRALRGETVNNTRYTLRRKDTGETWTGSYSFSPIRDKDGVTIGSVVVARDITEQQQMQEELRKSRDELELRVQERTAELERSNQALQDFASIASHDLQEPLRKVTAFGNMLKQKCGGSLEDHGKDYLERILNANQRMQSLLTGLLDYSRVTTKAEPFKEVDLSDIISEVLSDLEVRIVKTGGEVHVGDLPVISADPTQMRQLFQNLIGNALKFHKPGEKPMVQVRSLSNTDSGCQIVVEDNGIGFDEQYRERIFAPFQRLHGRSEYEGTGMGLAICKKIVERHGGSITAKSTPGKGSTFLIMLPHAENPGKSSSK
jgi:PAS domain S-box-containing protein